MLNFCVTTFIARGRLTLHTKSIHLHLLLNRLNFKKQLIVYFLFLFFNVKDEQFGSE